MHGVLSYLQALEAESLHILCEVAAEFARLVMLYSVGKDSSALLRLARKAFYPGPIPFPLLHVNTTYKSPEMLAFRDELALGGFDAAIGGAGSRRARGHAHSVRARRRWFDGTQEACGVFLAVAAELLRFVACGSLDDGKSTLIGRLLYESRGVYEDQLQAVRRATPAGCGQELELAFITDGLRAERQQGIAIDVAYRYFSTPRRKFIIADAPSHQQYTRNMVTGASTADLALILLDARKGVLPQSRRHAHIASLLGIRHPVVAVNKMDLVDYRREAFEQVRAGFARPQLRRPAHPRAVRDSETGFSRLRRPGGFPSRAAWRPHHGIAFPASDAGEQVVLLRRG